MLHIPRIASPSLVPSIEPMGEAKFATQDGRIWPVQRGEMTHAAPIRARMVEDLLDLIRERGDDAVVTSDDLSHCGWTRAQIATHGAAAKCRVMAIPRGARRAAR